MDPPVPTTLVVVDWSGAADGGASGIRCATVRDGRVVELVGGRDRDATVAALGAIVPPALVGLDFAFGFPAWFARRHGCTNGVDQWWLAAACAERWLRTCPFPFWGRRGTRRPVDVEVHRACELSLRAAGSPAKSVFQLAGPGAVGTGSLRGMPHLLALRAAGFAIWPFDPPGDRTVVEVYPRRSTGRVVTSDPSARATRLDRFAPGALDAGTRETAIASADAFDAVVTALDLWEHREPWPPPQPTDARTRLEGAVWPP